MPFRRRRSFRRSRAKRDLLWVSNSVAQTTGAGLTASVQLLAPSEWQVGANSSFERATVLAVRGWLSFNQTGTPTSPAPNAALYGAIYKNAVSAPPMDPAALVDYDDHDILWTFGGSLREFGISEIVIRNELQWWPIDIKTKRKVNSSENIELAINCAGGGTPGTVEVTGILRVLVDRT